MHACVMNLYMYLQSMYVTLDRVKTKGTGSKASASITATTTRCAHMIHSGWIMDASKVCSGWYVSLSFLLSYYNLLTYSPL